MAIIFPAKCRGVTAGALRQLRQDGYSSANGGLWDAKIIEHHDATMYFNKIEPAGVFMETLEKTKVHIGENTDAIIAASHRLVDAARDGNKRLSDVTGKFRDGTERLGCAMDKLMKVVGRSDFEETVRLAESLVDSLERLAVLEEKGLLDKVMKAMQQ